MSTETTQRHYSSRIATNVYPEVFSLLKRICKKDNKEMAELVREFIMKELREGDYSAY